MPIAEDDTNSLGEDGGSVGGNVLTDVTADVFGADGADSAGGVTAIRTGIETATGTAGSLNTPLQGTYGTLELAEDGTYTYTITEDMSFLDDGESRADSFTYTMKDGDTDTDAATLTVTINGSGDDPTLVVTTGDTGDVYEAGLTPDGSGVGSTVTTVDGTFKIADPDGLDDITHVKVGTTVIAETDLGNNNTINTGHSTLVITSYNDTTGVAEFTYTLTGAVADIAGLEQDIFNLSVSDDGGTSYSATDDITITITDDVPVNIRPDFAYLNNEGTPSVPVSVTEALDFDDNIDNNIGADRDGTINFSSSLIGDSGLTSNGLAITYAIAGDTLTATAGGNPVFTVTLNHDATDADDTYTVTMVGTVDGGVSEIQFNDGSYDFVGGNGSWAGFNTLADDDSPDLLLTPMIGGVSAGTLNTTAKTGGVAGGSSVGSGEAMRVDFVTDLLGTPESGKDYSNPIYQNHTFDGHYETNGASASFDKIGKDGSTIRIKAFDDFDSDHSVGDGAEDSITAIAIEYNNQTTKVSFGDIGTTATTYVVGGNSFTVQFMEVDLDPDPNAVKYVYEAVIQNVVDYTSIATYTADNYSSIEYHYESGSTFTIGDFATTTVDPGAPVDITLPIEIVDADGDIADGTIDVLLLPEDSPVPQDFTDHVGPDGVNATSTSVEPHIIGSDYDDTLDGDGNSNILYGQDGDDTLDGGAGNDYINAGAGDDAIVFDAADSTIDGGEGYDTLLVADDGILDFSNVQNIEKLDLNDDTTGQTVELTMQQVFDMTGDGNLTIGGVPTLELSGSDGDKVKIDTADWDQQGTTGLFIKDDGSGDAVMIDIADDAAIDFSVVDQGDNVII